VSFRRRRYPLSCRRAAKLTNGPPLTRMSCLESA
jgi:hypothetical protein